MPHCCCYVPRGRTRAMPHCCCVPHGRTPGMPHCCCAPRGRAQAMPPCGKCRRRRKAAQEEEHKISLPTRQMMASLYQNPAQGNSRVQGGVHRGGPYGPLRSETHCGESEVARPSQRPNAQAESAPGNEPRGILGCMRGTGTGPGPKSNLLAMSRATVGGLKVGGDVREQRGSAIVLLARSLAYCCFVRQTVVCVEGPLD